MDKFSVIFENPADEFVAARARATNGGVPGAILSAVERGGFADQAFDAPNLDGFLSTTSKIYVRRAVQG